MATATSTCSFINPVQFDGTPPGSSIDYFQFASSTCITISDDPATSTVELSVESSPENPLVVQDSGSVIFGLALILFVICVAVFRLIFPSSRKGIL